MKRIGGGTRVAGVVGRPIAHSLSPLIHNAWISAAGLDAVYVAFAPEDDDGFDALVAAGRGGAFAGLNVTAPFKAAALARADDASERAHVSGAANILIFRGREIRGDNTDGGGLFAALSEQAPDLDVTAAPVVVLGAGGAARGAVAALVEAGVTDIRVVNRTAERAQALADRFAQTTRVCSSSDALTGAGLVINALSVPPALDLSLLRDNAVVMDMTYRPLETAFLAAARARGLTGVDGLAMLIGQARPSFEAIFGISAPDVDVRGMALAALGDVGP